MTADGEGAAATATGHSLRGPDSTDRTRRRLTTGTVYRQVLLPGAGVVATVGLWWLMTWLFQIRPVFLPAPPDVLAALTANAPYLLDESVVTVLETLAGFGFGAVAGLVAAVGLTVSRTLERATLPLVVGLNAIPKVALAPLLVMWLGLGHAPKVALAASICFFPIMLAAWSGLTSTPSDLGELARSLAAPRWKTFLKIRVPWALPQTFVGLKLGMTLAVIGAVVAQLARPSGGLGTVILLSGQTVNTSLAFAAILLLMLISITLFYTVVLAERLLIPWARATAADRST